LDVGSTLIKAVVFDRRGRVLAAASRSVPLRRPQRGWVERDAEATWRAAAAAVRHVAAGRNIAAVGLTGCGNGAVFVDAQLKALRPGILSSDLRALRWIRQDKAAGQLAYAGQAGPLLRWLRAEEPAVARQLGHVLLWKDFIRARLTGVVATEPTDAGAAGWLVPGSRTLRRGDSALPPIRESLASAGEVTAVAERCTGLRAGTPVFMGCIDCEATALGSGVATSGELSLVAGTWSISQQFVHRRPRRRDLFLVNPSVQPGRWLALEGSPTSSANLDWVVRLLGFDGVAGALRCAESVARSGLLFVPRVPTGGGAFAELDAAHGRGDVVRAVVEGVAFAHRAQVERLLSPTAAPRRVCLTGGLARSAFVSQTFADVLGCPVEVPAGGELGALGAALCAGVGLGVWPTLREAQRATVRIAATFRPDPRRRAEFQRDYLRYRALVASLT
jgi:L-xylulokinase